MKVYFKTKILCLENNFTQKLIVFKVHFCIFIVMSTIGIYKITNPKGKIYIGQSTNIENRFKCYNKLHCKDQPLIFNSLKKYGVQNHIFEIIKICDISSLNDDERFFIKKYDSTDRNKGLNLTHGGQDYFKHSEVTRKKMSEAQKGNKKTKGRKQTKEEIAKRVKKLKGQKRSTEIRAKMSNSQKNKKSMTLETKNKISKSLKYRNAKKVIDITDKTVYKSPEDAAIAIGIKKSTLIAKLNGQNKNNTNLRYL